MAEGSQGIMDRMRGWYNWLTTHVPSSIKKQRFRRVQHHEEENSQTVQRRPMA